MTQSIAVTAVHAILSNHSTPGEVIRLNSYLKIIKNYELIYFRDTGNGIMKALVEVCLHIVRIGDGWDVSTDNDMVLSLAFENGQRVALTI